MDVEFDSNKDEANIAKHGVSFARAGDLEIQIVLRDARFSEEARYRAYGQLDGVAYCLAFIMRGQSMRAISPRRARAKAFKRYTAQVD